METKFNFKRSIVITNA